MYIQCYRRDANSDQIMEVEVQRKLHNLPGHLAGQVVGIINDLLFFYNVKRERGERRERE